MRTNKLLGLILIIAAAAVMSSIVFYSYSDNSESPVQDVSQPVSNEADTAIRAKVSEYASTLAPDRVNIVSVTQKDQSTYAVEANVVDIPNADKPNEPAGVYPITLSVVSSNGKWQIASVSKGAYSELPTRVTKEGHFECLPHKNKTGPQTMECAFGLAVDNSDSHFAIDTSLLQTYPVNYPFGAHLRVEGIMTPANQLSSNMWQRYDIDGIISATSITKL